MHRWHCQVCGEVVSSAFERNLDILVDEHRKIDCPMRNVPLEKRPITAMDRKFLEELKVGW